MAQAVGPRVFDEQLAGINQETEELTKVHGVVTALAQREIQIFLILKSRADGLRNLAHRVSSLSDVEIKGQARVLDLILEEDLVDSGLQERAKERICSEIGIIKEQLLKHFYILRDLVS